MLKINKRWGFYALLIACLLLALIRYAFQMDVPRIFLTALIIAIAMFGDRDEILAILLGCIPLHNAIDFYTAILACALIYVLKNPKKTRVNAATVLFLIIMVYELLHCFSAEFSLKLFLVDITPLLALTVIVSMDQQDVNYAFVVRSMALCSVCMCAILLAQTVVLAHGDFSVAFLDLKRLGMLADEEFLIGSEINPNSLGVINLLATTGLLQISLRGQRRKTDLFMILLLLVFGILTLSRTFLICLLLMIVLWVLGQPGSVKKKMISFVCILVVAAVLLLLMTVIFPGVLDNYLDRFRSDDITTGRDVIMTQYQSYIQDHTSVLFFGVGTHNFMEKVTNIYAISSHTPHNSIQEIVVAWGLIGLLLVATLLIAMILEAKQYHRRLTVLNYIPLLLILAKSMAGQLLTSGYTILALGFAYLSLCQDFDGEADRKR